MERRGTAAPAGSDRLLAVSVVRPSVYLWNCVTQDVECLHCEVSLLRCHLPREFSLITYVKWNTVKLNAVFSASLDFLRGNLPSATQSFYLLSGLSSLSSHWNGGSQPMACMPQRLSVIIESSKRFAIAPLGQWIYMVRTGPCFTHVSPAPGRELGVE